MNIPAFDVLYSVSDLHIGGSPDFRIFDDADALASLIDEAAAHPAKRVVFVANGDVLDFLAATDADAYSTTKALRHLNEVLLPDLRLAPIFDALRRFTATPGRTLVVIVGNHDVEIAHPEVREALAARIQAPGSTIEWCTRQEGFRCMVGTHNVLCLHGNVTDAWNRVAPDYADSPTDAPNAGSLLVSRVLNKAKRRFRWLDVLKPEGLHLALIALALDNDTADPLLGPREHTELVAISVRLAKDAAAGTFLTAAPAWELSSEGYLASQLGKFKYLLKRFLDAAQFSDPGHRDEQWKQLARLHKADGTDIVIAGHTHAPRAGALTLGSASKGQYINTGTWAYVMTLTKQHFDVPEKFVELERILRLPGNDGWNQLKDAGLLQPPRGYAFVDAAGAQLRRHR